MTSTIDPKIKRLNYIGSKYKLLDWIDAAILECTCWLNFEGKTAADLFSGTGIVAHHYRDKGATVISNDAELYSSIIAEAFTRSIYTEFCSTFIERINRELGAKIYESLEPGFVTLHYSPHGENDRMFFTVDNARRIDYVREQIDAGAVDPVDKAHLLASLLISADAVSNVPAVYGCYLKNFKTKATKAFCLEPVHTSTIPASAGSRTYHLDALSDTLISEVNAQSANFVYLDPPYNERQYSKNYFPLNIIAKSPAELAANPVALKGKTGIPADCFISPFCKKGKTVEDAFDKLARGLTAPYIFISYSSEGLVSKEKMLEILGRYGAVNYKEREYKRFKSFEYNKDTPTVTEYLFCLKKL